MLCFTSLFEFLACVSASVCVHKQLPVCVNRGSVRPPHVFTGQILPVPAKMKAAGTV